MGDCKTCRHRKTVWTVKEVYCETTEQCCTQFTRNLHGREEFEECSKALKDFCGGNAYQPKSFTRILRWLSMADLNKIITKES